MAKKQTKQAAVDPFNFDFDGEVDESLFGSEDKTQFPGVTWLSKFAGKKDEDRIWVINMDKISDIPSPFWQETEVLFGDDPTKDPEMVFATSILRCAPIDIRMRKIVETEAGQKISYNIFTSPHNMEQGKLEFHYQVLVNLAGTPFDELVVLGLRGFTRTVSWDHDGKRYAGRGFGLGVKQKLEAYIEKASKARGKALPFWCFWDIDLRGEHKNGKPNYIGVGPQSNTYVQPFTVDMRLAHEVGASFKNVMPSGHRFVGMERYEVYKEIRKIVAPDWKAEWDYDTPEKLEERSYENGNGNGHTPIGPEEDEIPF